MKFPGKNLQELLPKRSFQKAILPLPRPVDINQADITINNLPRTRNIIRLDKAIEDNDKVSGSGFCVALIDSGVSHHRDIEEAIVDRISCNEDENDKYDLHGHGTHIAGLIAGRGSNVAGRGVSPGAAVLSFKVTSGRSGDVSWHNVIKAMDEIISSIIKWNESSKTPMISVVNLSINANDNLLKSDRINKHILIGCINELYKKNVPVVVSSGNNYEQFKKFGLAYPAYHPNVISVGAVCNFDFEGYVEDSIAPFSQRIPEGVTDTSCFVLAPGVFTISLSNTNKTGYGFLTGSSLAAPVVTGIILLMQELAMKGKKRIYKNLPPVDLLKKCLKKGSTEIINSPAENSPYNNQTRLYYDSLQYKRVDTVSIINELKDKLNLKHKLK